jgi:copper(I)-binding protein
MAFLEARIAMRISRLGKFIRRRDFISLVGRTATLLLHAMTSACAADIVVRQAWSRATPKGAQVASGYLTIENRSNSADRLLSASTPAAGKVEIHEMLDAGGIMKMRPVTAGLTIPPSGHLVLTPGGSHMMFLELKSPFSEGEQIPVSLDFENAGQINISLKVGGIGAKGPQLSAPSEPTARLSASGTDPFFTHIHDPRLMANVTVSPGRSGPVEVLVQLEDPEENPLAAEGLSVTLSNPDSGIAPITTTAERIASDTWLARMLVSEAGKWSLALRIAMTSKEKVEIAAPILIE